LPNFLIIGTSIAIIKDKHSDREHQNKNRSTIELIKNNIKTKGDIK